MIEGIAITVVGGLILAGIILLIRSVADKQKREDLTERVKQATCHHQWSQSQTTLDPMSSSSRPTRNGAGSAARVSDRNGKPGCLTRSRSGA